MRRSRLPLIVAMLALAVIPVRVLRAQDTPMDHAALAASYAQEAKDAQAKAASHEAMLGRYKSSLPKGGALNNPMIAHCQKLVDSYKEAGKQATDLAQAHREMAGAAE